MIYCEHCEKEVLFKSVTPYIEIHLRNTEISTKPAVFHMECFELVAGSDFIKKMLPDTRKSKQFKELQEKLEKWQKENEQIS